MADFYNYYSAECNASANVAPTFTGGTTSMSMAHDSGATSLVANLHVTDTDSSQTETWTVTAGPSHGTITFTGSASSSSATHASGTDVAPTATDITYTPTAGYSGTDSVTFQVADSNGTPATASRTISFTVTNSAPVLTAGATAAYTEKGSAVAVDGTITVADSDNSTEKSATAVISGNAVSGDTLSFTNDGSTMGNIIASWTAGTYSLALSSTGSTATKAQWQAALRAVTFSASTTNPTSAQRTVTWNIDDGITTSHASNSPTSMVNVTTINDAPSLSGNMALAAVDEDTTSPASATITSLASAVTFLRHR